MGACNLQLMQLLMATRNGCFCKPSKSGKHSGAEARVSACLRTPCCLEGLPARSLPDWTACYCPHSSRVLPCLVVLAQLQLCAKLRPCHRCCLPAAARWCEAPPKTRRRGASAAPASTWMTFSRVPRQLGLSRPPTQIWRTTMKRGEQVAGSGPSVAQPGLWQVTWKTCLLGLEAAQRKPSRGRGAVCLWLSLQSRRHLPAPRIAARASINAPNPRNCALPLCRW